MEYFRITKYNPIFRDKNDIYRNKDKWIWYFKEEDNIELFKEYKIVEWNYIDLLLEILDIIKIDIISSKWLFLSEEQVKNCSDLLYLDKFIKKCFIDNKDKIKWIKFNSIIKNYKWIKINNLLYSRLDWENYWIYYLKDEIKFPKNIFENIFKLSLRWFSWIFYFFWKNIKIRFWYDFYMYLSVKEWVITNEIINKYYNKWLFIEKNEDFKSFFGKINFS